MVTSMRPNVTYTTTTSRPLVQSTTTSATAPQTTTMAPTTTSTVTTPAAAKDAKRKVGCVVSLLMFCSYGSTLDMVSVVGGPLTMAMTSVVALRVLLIRGSLLPRKVTRALKVHHSWLSLSPLSALLVMGIICVIVVTTAYHRCHYCLSRIIVVSSYAMVQR
jgi:hypothetical protein